MFARYPYRSLGMLLVLAAGLLIAGCQAPGGTTGTSGGSLLRLPGLSGGDYATVFTVLCMEAKGTDGPRRVEQMAAGLRNVPQLDARLVKTETIGPVNRLYYGAYKGEPKPQYQQFAPPLKARQDLAFIANLGSGAAQPFRLARIIELPTPDPGRPEWDLKNAPGVYSLQICFCMDRPGMPNRKEAAVAIVEALRQQGEEAWYLHQQRASIVAVGHFDESAVQMDAQGIGHLSAEVQRFRLKREEFKYNTDYLQKVNRTVNGQRVVSESTLIRIPRETTNEPAVQQPLQPRAQPRFDPFGHR